MKLKTLQKKSENARKQKRDAYGHFVSEGTLTLKDLEKAYDEAKKLDKEQWTDTSPAGRLEDLSGIDWDKVGLLQILNRIKTLEERVEKLEKKL